MRDTIRMFVLENFLFSHDARALRNDASFTQMGIMDSMGALELMTFLDDTFGISVAETDIFHGNIDSIDRIVAFLDRKLSRRALR